MKQKRLLLFTTLLIVISFVLTTTVSVMSLRTVIRGNNEELSKVMASQIYDTINNRLTEPIVAAQTMSLDFFLTEPMKAYDFPNKEQEDDVVSYLRNISDTMNYSSAFIISDRSGKYYTQDGFNKIVDPETDAHDIWYSTFLDTGKKIDFDIDTDEAHGNQWTVFVNARIEDHEGNLLGVCGVSVVMTDLQDILKGYVDEYGVNISLINDEDAIAISGGEVAVEEAVLESTQLLEYQANSGYIYEDLGNEGYRVRKYMDNLDWLLVVGDDGASDNPIFATLIYRNMVIFLVIMIILIGLVASNINYDKKRTEEYTRQIEEFAREQEELKKQAQSASVAKGDFLANMSHEIRTPINAVLGFDEMILRESEDAAILSYADNIKNSGKTLLSLINDILDFSKIESGKMDIVPVEYNIVSMLCDLISMIMPRAEEKGLEIKKEISAELPQKLLGDDVRIRQVITNLLTNAVKYTEKGSITLCVSGKRTNDNEILLKVAVKDTGIGIKEEDQQKLFDAFQRVDESRNRSIEGTGLGLSITTRVLELMGSKLILSSTYGEGSVFSFDLLQKISVDVPIGDFEDASKKEYSKEQYKTLFFAPEARILVVDDIEMNLLVFKGLLKQTKVRIDMAESGMDAIALVEENHYDLIFMDHLMPAMDGIETLQEMKASLPECIEDVPVIALTANAVSGARELYEENGFSDYLTKPIDGELLEEMCVKWLPPKKISNVSKEQNEEKKPQIPMRDALVDQAIGLDYCAGDMDFYIDMVKSYFSTGHGEKLTEAFQKEDWENYRVYAHSLKSTSLTVGAVPLSNLAKSCELSLKESGDPEFVKAHHKELMDLLGKTVQCLQVIIKENV